MTTKSFVPVTDVAQEALAHTREALERYSFDRDESYYTFADKTIVPTFLTRAVSRADVDTHQNFRSVKSEDVRLFPAFGASMSFMRSRFARDLYHPPDERNAVGGLHILPRVGFSDEQRLRDIQESQPALIGTALGIKEDEAFLDEVFGSSNLTFASIDIAHGANAAVIPLLKTIRRLGMDEGIILGNVGSVEGFLYAYWLMKLVGFESCIIKVGIGPGSVCTTRTNTGVGVGQLTLLEQIYRVRYELGYQDVQIISDGGVDTAGDFVKALVYSDGVMMGKFFASGSFEDEVLIQENGTLQGIKLYGMASAMVTEKRNYIEGSSQTLRSFHRDAQEAVRRLREGLQSAMTYVNATTLSEFRSNVRFARNSAASIREGGVH